MILYVDILLCLNLFIDFLLLCGTARVLHLPRKRVRMIAGAAVGALSSLVILLPPLPFWLTACIRVLCAAAMVAAAFPFRGIAAYLRNTLVLFIVSAIFAGVCEALWLFAAPSGLFVQSGVVYYDVPPLLLIILTTVAYGGLCLYERLTVKRVARHAAYRIMLCENGKTIALTAMLDTGCHLCEPFSGAPVILVKRSLVSAMFDSRILADGKTAPVRYIPFSALGGEGILPAFRPARVTVYVNERAFDVSGAWVAATDALVHDEYDALIGPALVDRLPLHQNRKELV